MRWSTRFTRPYMVQRQEGMLKRFVELGIRDVLMIPLGKANLADWYFDGEQMKVLEKNIYDLFIDKERFDHHIKAHVDGKKELLGLFKSMGDSREELLSLYKEFARITKSDFSAVYPIVVGLDGYPVQKLKEGLTEEQWEIIQKPTALIEIQRLQIKVSRLHEEEKLEEEMANLLENYCWITVYDLRDKAADEEYLRKLIIDGDKVEEMEREIEDNRKEVEAVLATIDNEKIRQGLRALNYYIAFRSDRMDTLKILMYYLNAFFRKVEKLGDYSYEQLTNFTLDEMEEYLATGKGATVDERLDTTNYHMYHDGEFRLVTTEEEKAEIREDIVEQKGLKGVCASKGKVIGRVKVVHSMSELDKVEEGDILVTVMTKPEFVPAMKKAAGFVTDEGGITCHAAILAREMKKPCVIGTNNATKELKDGDVVEVDEGVVRKVRD
ncbi:PEP-utilizing enzyme [Nanoarchaeota archaeon]